MDFRGIPMDLAIGMTFQVALPSLKLTWPLKKWCLKDDPFLLGFGNFSGAFALKLLGEGNGWLKSFKKLGSRTSPNNHTTNKPGVLRKILTKSGMTFQVLLKFPHWRRGDLLPSRFETNKPSWILGKSPWILPIGMTFQPRRIAGRTVRHLRRSWHDVSITIRWVRPSTRTQDAGGFWDAQAGATIHVTWGVFPTFFWEMILGTWTWKFRNVLVVFGEIHCQVQKKIWALQITFPQVSGEIRNQKIKFLKLLALSGDFSLGIHGLVGYNS